jgi:hypothetical protein
MMRLLLQAVLAVVLVMTVAAWSRIPAHNQVVSDPGVAYEVSLLRDQLIRWQAEDQARAAMPTATGLLSSSRLPDRNWSRAQISQRF